MLSALLSGHRHQTLYFLDLRNLRNSKASVKFSIGDVLKHSRAGKHQAELVFPGYPPDRRLCVRTVFMEYISRTESLREGTHRVFISYVKPHGPVSKDTISRWIKSVMTAAGIDMCIFNPHSTRSASTSAASRNNVPLKTILQTAGWSRESTFAKYYKKPLDTRDQFATSILNKSKK